MAHGGRGTLSPIVSFRDLLSTHLEIMEQMTLGDSLTSKPLEDLVIGFRLYPPKFLEAIHRNLRPQYRSDLGESNALPYPKTSPQGAPVISDKSVTIERG